MSPHGVAARPWPTLFRLHSLLAHGVQVRASERAPQVSVLMAQEQDREPSPPADAKGAAVVWSRPEAPGLSSVAQSATQDGVVSPQDGTPVCQAVNASHIQEASNADLESAGNNSCGPRGSGQGEGLGQQRMPAICVWGMCDVQGLLRITVVLDSPRTTLTADEEGEGLWTKVADAMGLGQSSVGALVSGLAHMRG